VQLADVIPDADVLAALEPEELGLHLLPVLAEWHGQSPLTLCNFLVVVRGDKRDYPGQYPHERSSDVEVAIREAWAWLEGSALLIKDSGHGEPNDGRMLSRRARQLAEEPQRALSARRVPKDALHLKIRENVWALYHRGKYDTAVLEAMKAVEVAAREAAGLTVADLSTKLMRKAFDVEHGRLSDKTAEPSERQALSDLFAGAIGAYKNPQSHRNVELDDPDEVAEIIMLANHLLRIIDARRPVPEDPSCVEAGGACEPPRAAGAMS
jgi:uncharacterized protein (TIGR02391 family)